MFIGFGTWYLQEQVTPATNIRQDSLRSQLKNQVPRTVTSTGRQWLASLDSQRLYSFDYANHESEVDAIVLFEFDDSGTHLARIVRAGSARWVGNENIKLNDAEVFRFTNQMVTFEKTPDMLIPQTEKYALFKPSIDKPSQLNAKQLSEYIKLNKQRGVDVAGMLVALYRKYAEPFGAIVMMMLGAPLALSFGRKNVVAGLCIAILVGIAFWAASGGFQQLGSLGLLPAAVAALAPFAIFGSVGLYLLSRTRT
jgi:lipopolysaccharide export LptBFGC system permease protein LptF